MEMRAREWTALVCVGWALAGLQLLTLQWTPDCGGLSYGLPLPYLEASMASSLEFELHLGPFLVDFAVYLALLAAPAWWLVRALGGCPRLPRRLVLGVALLPWLTLLPQHLELAIGAGPRLSLAGPSSMKVYEWRAVRPWTWGSSWGTHLEARCD
jgi:hypothetical protein